MICQNKTGITVNGRGLIVLGSKDFQHGIADSGISITISLAEGSIPGNDFIASP